MSTLLAQVRNGLLTAVACLACGVGCGDSSQPDDRTSTQRETDSGTENMPPDELAPDASPPPKPPEPPPSATVEPMTPMAATPAPASPSADDTTLPPALPAPPFTSAGIPETCAIEPASEAARGAGDACPTGIHTGDVLFETGYDVDALAGCTRIEGNVMIQGDAVTNLAALEKLRVVTGNITAVLPECTWAGCPPGAAGTFSPHGLEHLRCVGGDLTMQITPCAMCQHSMV